MRLFVNNQPVVLKSGQTIDYTIENPVLTEAEGFTLELQLPLAGCAWNLSLFGDIYRTDQAISQTYPARIEHGSFIRYGVLTILEVTESMISAQFLDGQSQSNLENIFDTTYIHQQSIPTPADYVEYINSHQSDYDPADSVQPIAWRPADSDHPRKWLDLSELRDIVYFTGSSTGKTYAAGLGGGYDFITLPWINNYSGNQQNIMRRVSPGSEHPYALSIYRSRNNESNTPDADTEEPTYQIYLISLVRKLLDAQGYTYDLTQWESKPADLNLVVFNCAPAVWNITNYARLLPHWTYTEFFDNLGKLLGGLFLIDHQNKHVTFRTFNSYYHRPNYYDPGKILHKYTRSIETDAGDLALLKILEYSKPDSYKSDYYFFTDFKTIRSYISTDPSDLYSIYYDGTNYYAHFIDAVDDQGTITQYHDVRLGVYGTPEQDSTGAQYTPQSVRIQPVIAEDLLLADSRIFSRNALPVIPCGELESYDGEPTPSDPKTPIQRIIEDGFNDQEIFSNLIIGSVFFMPYGQDSATPLTINPSAIDPNTNLTPVTRLQSQVSEIPQFDAKKILTCSFIADTIPAVNSIFVINSQLYICKQLEITLHSESVDPILIKGTFYPITSM